MPAPVFVTYRWFDGGRVLRSDRPTALPLEVASELRDALSRRQKELPPRWLAAYDAIALRDESPTAPAHALEDVERDLAVTLIRGRLANVAARGIVCVQPSASGITPGVVREIALHTPVSTIIAAELDQSLAIEMADRLCPRNLTSAAIACDPTVDLPLPINFPHPRVYLCLGNTLGRSTAVGAVRMLRVMRTTMAPGDSVILGLTGRRVEPLDATTDPAAAPARHLAALGLIQSTTGACFDLDRFDYKPTWDRDNARLETHLVARRAFDLALPGVCDVRFRKGESIRTSVSCVFDRARVAAMLSGVGLALRDWTTDPAGSYVVALAVPAS